MTLRRQAVVFFRLFHQDIVDIGRSVDVNRLVNGFLVAFASDDILDADTAAAGKGALDICHDV